MTLSDIDMHLFDPADCTRRGQKQKQTRIPHVQGLRVIEARPSLAFD